MEVRTELVNHISISTMETDGGMGEQIETAEVSLNDSSLAQFQSEALGQFSTLTSNFDSMVSDQKCDERQIVHALAEDGTTVPLTLDHETGQYMTADGLPVTISTEAVNKNGEELLGAAEASGHTNDAIETQEEIDNAQDIHLDVSDESLQDQSVSAICANSIVMDGEQSLSSQINSNLMRVKANQKVQIMKRFEQPIKIVPKEHNNFAGGSIIRVLNPDGTLSDLNPIQNHPIRVLNSDGTRLSSLPDSFSQNIRLVQLNPATDIQPRLSVAQPQIRFNHSDGIVPTGKGIAMKNPVSTQPIRVINTQDTQQIQVINADGLSPGNFRIISSGSQRGTSQSMDPPSKVRIVNTLPKSPVKAISLAQAQQMGLVSATGSRNALKILPKSPVNIRSPQKLPVGSTIRTSDGKTIIIGSPKKQQIIIQPSNVPPITAPQGQQIIRMPAKVSSQPEIQQISSGGKVQYIRVINSQSQQGIRTLTNSVPITGLVKTQRAILPSPASNSPSENLHTRVLAFQETQMNNVVGIAPKIEPKQESVEPVSTQAYEAFLSKKEEKPKAGQGNVFDAPGVRPRKPCNCTKSQCLKLYCDCFANGEFCFNCNCTNCYNNLQHERQRQKSIKQCLDRNPSAFRPKIGKAVVDGERRHNKGCNCKRSGCLKNYCECYEAKIPCTDSCKCIGCKNLEEETEVATPAAKQEHLMTSLPPTSVGAPAAVVQTQKLQNLKSRLVPLAATNNVKTVDGVTQLFSFVTTEVVEATCMCLMERANEAEKEALSETEIEGMIIEEFGRCLKQIIEMAKKSSSNNSITMNAPDS